MTQQMSLANQLLVAMPSQDSELFTQSVIYICEHRVEGTVGLIINHPIQYQWRVIFDQLHITATNKEKENMPLLLGGPIQTERGFVIHRPPGHWRSSIDLLDDEVTITTSNDIIRAIAVDTGPKDALVALGYVAWDDNQLEQEIINDVWLVCPYKAELLYDVPFAERWKKAGLMLGVDMNKLISDGGHA